LIEVFKEGGRRAARDTAGGAALLTEQGRRKGVLEVADGPDGRGPAVNEREGRKGRVGPARGWWAGRRDGPAARSGLCGRKKKEDGPRWAGMREGRERREVWYFFQILFQTFKSLNSFKTFSTFKLFSKIFKSI
jgi:hypothetical protein